MSQEAQKNEQETLPEVEPKEKTYLHTHTLINNYLCGDIVELKKGYCEVKLEAENEMVVDEEGLVHGGFIFGAADFAAMAAINEPTVVLVASECQFLAPAKLGDTIIFKAQARHQEGRKRIVHVRGYLNDVKIFEGEFMTVITERHVLKLKLLKEENQKE